MMEIICRVEPDMLIVADLFVASSVPFEQSVFEQ
jgi:hypothetical protein